MPECEKKKFSEALPYRAKKSVFAAITPDTNCELPRPEHVAQFLSLLLSSLPDNDVLPDIFDDLAARSLKFWMPNIDLKEKREAVQRKINEILEARESECPDRQFIVARGIANLRDAPCIAEFFPDLEYLRALNALSSGNFDEARKHAEKALDLCIGWSIGPLKLDIARLNFSLAVALDAFSRGSAERSFRILCKSVQPQDSDRWKIGEGPIDYSMRLAAADHAAWFWGAIVRPYEGVAIETPLQQDSEIIRAYTALLVSGAPEEEVRDFIKKFRGKLKRKLRDVRGDTFFTLTSKMVPDLARDMRQMPTYPGIPKTPSELANSIAATHLNLVSLLPTDVLDARDYLKQTALMLAAERKDVDMVRALLDRHVDLDAQDVIGRTALHAAARVGADRVFEVLLAAGANPTLQTFLGKTPAIFAAEFGRATIFEMRLACTAYQMDKSELKEAYELALVSAKNFKAKRKEYASQGHEIAGRKGFQRIVELALEKLDK